MESSVMRQLKCMLQRPSALTLALAAMLPAAAMAAPPYVAIEKRLSAEQLHETGLDTLSAEQLAALNRVLSEGEVVRVRDEARDSIGLKEKREQATGFDATAKGDIREWSKGDVVELDNGQRWRVVEGQLYLGK